MNNDTQQLGTDKKAKQHKMEWMRICVARNEFLLKLREEMNGMVFKNKKEKSSFYSSSVVVYDKAINI